jgi:hypothetical protein
VIPALAILISVFAVVAAVSAGESTESAGSARITRKGPLKTHAFGAV